MIEISFATRTHRPDLELAAENQRPKTSDHRDLKLYQFDGSSLFQWWSKRGGSVFEDPCDGPFLIDVGQILPDGRCTQCGSACDDACDGVSIDSCPRHVAAASIGTPHLVARDIPIPMLLFCPKCGAQHIDEADNADTILDKMGRGEEPWTNPPHRSHLCHACGCIWRPADVATSGVKEIQTKGSADTWTNDKPIVIWTIASDGPYPPGDTRKWLARQLMDSKLSDAEAYGIVKNHPAVDDR